MNNLDISWHPDILLKEFKSFPWFESHNKSMTLKHEYFLGENRGKQNRRFNFLNFMGFLMEPILSCNTRERHKNLFFFFVPQSKPFIIIYTYTAKCMKRICKH